MNKFENRLFDDLLRDHGAALALAERPARRRVPRAAGIAATLTASATAVGLLFVGGGGAAFAVTENPDGTVSVRIDDPSGVGPANERLAELGAGFQVRLEHAKPCGGVTIPPGTRVAWDMAVWSAENGVVVRPKDLPGAPVVVPICLKRW